MSHRIQSPYTAQYPNPIAFQRGDLVVLKQRDTDWPEFIWGIDANGREGWVHESFVDRDHGDATALRDYDARELGVKAGENVEVIESLGGWHWCWNEAGVLGWVPDKAFGIIDHEN